MVHKVKNKGVKIPHQKKRTHVYTTVAVRPPSVKKQSLLTKYYADRFLDLAAVVAAKQAKYLRAVLTELGFPPAGPTPIYEDNQSAINMINARIPTERSRHIDIQHFALQDWKEAGAIEMRFIPGVINPADDMTKPLGWILHSRHARRLMGHYL